MKASLLTGLWTHLVPTGVRFSAGFETGESTAAEPRDAAALTDPGALRAREFALGRWHARRALRELGIADAPLLRLADGAPGWPDGVVGSIAHTMERGRVFAIAAVAPRTLLNAIGIDVEAPGRIAARTWPALLSSDELARVVALEPTDRAQEVKSLWCAKEAVAKAMRPSGDIDAIVIEHDRRAAGYVARWLGPADGSQANAPSGECIGRVLDHAGWTCAIAARAAPLAGLDWPATDD